jgi:hypothetical protein
MAMWVCKMAMKEGKDWGPRANCKGVACLFSFERCYSNWT